MPENPKTGRWRAGHRRARSRLEPLAGVLAGGGDTADWPNGRGPGHGGRHRPHRRGDRPLNGRDVDASTVEHAALGTEIVLHVDHQHGTFTEIDTNRFRFCLYGD